MPKNNNSFLENGNIYLATEVQSESSTLIFKLLHVLITHLACY